MTVAKGLVAVAVTVILGAIERAANLASPSLAKKKFRYSFINSIMVTGTDKGNVAMRMPIAYVSNVGLSKPAKNNKYIEPNGKCMSSVGQAV